MENNEMNETEHLLSSHANAQRLFEGIEQIERGEIVPFYSIDPAKSQAVQNAIDLAKTWNHKDMSVEDFEKVINLIHKFYTNESK
jgi:hypothetical protein